MDQVRGVLLLTDPLHAAGVASEGRMERRMRSACDAGRGLLPVEFAEGERCLPQAQAALWEIRRRCSWVCVAAARGSAGVALALASQLPVDRLALIGGTPFSPLPEGGSPARRRDLRRLDAFARRNLSLVVAEILLVGVPEAEARRLMCGLSRGARVRIGADVDCFTEEWRDNGK